MSKKCSRVINFRQPKIQLVKKINLPEGLPLHYCRWQIVHGYSRRLSFDTSFDKDAARRCNADPDKDSRVIPHPDVGQAVPRTEASLALKLAKSKPKRKRSKKNLDGLYEVLAPGLSVIKSDAYTSLIKNQENVK